MTAPLGIAAQIAQAERTLRYLEATLGWPQGGASQAEIDAQNAILRMLEAARAWAEQLQPWMGCSIPYDSQSETAKLYRAIMGKP